MIPGKENKRPIRAFAEEFRLSMASGMRSRRLRKALQVLLIPVFVFAAYLFTSDAYIATGYSLYPSSGVYFEFMLGTFVLSVGLLMLLLLIVFWYSFFLALARYLS